MAPSSDAPAGQGYSRWVAKVPRMRSACTQCHAAKIRCSGDKTGCQRCSSLSLHCEYVVSMVGRTPKRQRKTSEARFANGTQPSPTERQASEASSGSSLPRTSCPPSSTRSSTAETTSASLVATANPPPPDNFDLSRTIFVSGADNPSLPTTDFTDEQLYDCFNDDNWVSGGTSCPTSLDDGSNFADATGLEIEGFSMPSDLPPLTTTSGPPSFLTSMVPQPPPPPLRSAMPSFFPMSPCSPGQSLAGGGGSGGGVGVASLQSGGGSQDWTQYAHVVALCKMIRLLENHVQTKSMAVDEVMRLSQACIRDISRISANKEYMQCKSCPALISTIMELIVTLYEGTTSANANANSTAAQQQQQQEEPQSSSSTLVSPTTLSAKPNGPFLQFGVFELDPEEQTAIRNRIIRKQAQECVQIIQMLKRLFEADSEGGRPDTTQSMALGNWCAGMEKRMNSLISSLTPAS